MSGYRVSIGDRLKLGNGPTYKITDIYFAQNDCGTTVCAFVDFLNESTGDIEPELMEDVQNLLRKGHLFRAESELENWYFKEIIQP